MIPEIIPAKGGAPDPKAIPKHNGRATKKTTKPEKISDLICFVVNIIFDIRISKKSILNKNYVFSGGGDKISVALGI